MLRLTALCALTLLSACKPPASDDYVSRTQITDERRAPSTPVASPDTQGAAWVRSEQSGRLLYGKPGEMPLFSLACEGEELVYRRYVAADEDAKAVLALIGNGHVERFFIDAHEEGDAWLWRGSVRADDPRLEVLTGPRSVEATIPGAGSMILNASRQPAEFITRCAGTMPALPDPEASPE